MKVDRKDVLAKVSSIKRGKNNYYDSNIFLVPNNISFSLSNDDALVYVWDDKGVQRVYFAASDPNALKSLLETLPPGTGIEMIGSEVNAETENAITSAGFSLFETYARASIYNLKEDVYKNIPDKYQDVKCWDVIQYAEKDHAEDIYNLLYNTFDPFTSHLPTFEEIRADIEKKNIVDVTEDGHVVAFIMFKIQGKKIYIEQIINQGKSLYMHALYMGILEKAMDDGINMAYTWVREGNDRAYALMRRYGYQWEKIRNFAYRKND